MFNAEILHYGLWTNALRRAGETFAQTRLDLPTDGGAQ